LNNVTFDDCLADNLSSMCVILCQLDKAYSRYINIGSPMVRSPFWHFMGLYSTVAFDNVVMTPLAAPNNFLESSVG
jgi:hypothetical protein